MKKQAQTYITYYFCSTGCLKRFQAEPEKYLNDSTPKTRAKPSPRKKTETAILGVDGMHCAVAPAPSRRHSPACPRWFSPRCNFAAGKGIIFRSGEALQTLRRVRAIVFDKTGDNPKTARIIAQQVGIERFIAGVLPAEKKQTNENLQQEFGTVAMVDDGINNAPALKAADVGIVIGSGTELAIAASDVTLIRGELSGVIKAVKLSRATFPKIKQNLFWALFYNLLAVPLTMLGLLHPLIAEEAMALFSINVVTNSLRLRRTAS